MNEIDFIQPKKIVGKLISVDVLDKIEAEIPKLVCCENEYRQALVKVADVIKCIDKHRQEANNEADD